MIELRNDQLVFHFPAVHDDATLAIDLQRTMRIPDDGREYPLPAGFGRFPLRHVDDYPDAVPDPWIDHGGVMLPMYQSEALWLHFSGEYPFALKVAAGKINAVTGGAWSAGLHRHPQDYLSIPTQPWLDGYCVERGVIRQFVAMPLGSGYSAEEQLTGKAVFGGIQLVAYPLKARVYERWRKRQARFTGEQYMCLTASHVASAPQAAMGLAPGGRMRQEIYDDTFALADWDTDHGSRCFLHLANSQTWRAITGEDPPTVPLTAGEYQKAGIPWFDFYTDASAVPGSSVLDGLDSIAEFAKSKGDAPPPANDSVVVEKVVLLRKGLRKDQVREGRF